MLLLLFNSNTGRPIFPPSSELFEILFRIWFINEVVVDLPFEPVTHIVKGFLFSLIIFLKNKPISLSILTEFSNALITAG